MRIGRFVRALLAPPTLCLLLLSAPQPARATVLTPLSTAEMVARADRIFVGTVEGQSAHWVDDSHSAIVTDVRIRVQRGMRGVKDGEVVTIRRLGGSVNGIGMKVFGEATFTAGEDVLVFAEPRGDAHWAVGMAQGKLHISTENGQKMVSANLQGAEFIQKGGPSGATVQQAVAQPRPLDEVLREVTRLVAQAAQKDAAKAPRGKAVNR